MEKDKFRGVEYFKGADLAKGHMLNKSKEVYEKLDLDTEIHNINEVMELYNINKYVEDGMLLRFLGEEKKKWLIEKNRIANKITGEYINQRTNLLDEYKEIYFRYLDTFWEIINKRKLSVTTNEKFKLFLQNNERFAMQIFKQHKLVIKFDIDLREYMLNHPEESTALLLDKYYLKHINEPQKYHLPQSLTLEDKEKIISKYLELDRPNLNYTRLIGIMQNTKEFSLDARIKLKAKKVSEKLEKEIFYDKNGYGIEIGVEFKNDVEGIVHHYFMSNGIGTEVDISWLKANMDNPTLLNNFIYIFEFVNDQMISKFPYNETEASVFERIGFAHEKEYKTCMIFSLRESLSLSQMHVYYSFLKNNNKHLEAIIEWFFNDYLKDEFKINNLNIKMPPTNNPNFEKCKSIFPTIESILKKYKFYLEDGYIDEELVQMESKPLPFYECPSMTNNRYLYLATCNNEAVILKNIMFSDQSDITYFPKYGEKQYDTLIERLSNDNLHLDAIEDYQKPTLDWLIEHHYVMVNDNKEIVLLNNNQIFLYYYIYKNGVIDFNKLSVGLRNEANNLLNQGALIAENTLLTRQESDYIDYYFNKSKFINGYDLRNKYLHGTSSGYNNENEHYVNYLHALRILITIMIKINDDLSTASVIE
ncbi:hypothetical protein [Lysinibacillus fusiformis]|uniref:hypothetical protein n=1 Tax=Lysinibacillus fusiformis TaxID=28031 RepID=UPI003CF6CA60